MFQALPFDKDSRDPCKYGKDCYQKNPDHLKKYKHPAIAKRESDELMMDDAKMKKFKETSEEVAGRAKTVTEETTYCSKTVKKPEHDISESSDSESEPVDNKVKALAATRNARHSIIESSDSDSADAHPGEKKESSHQDNVAQTSENSKSDDTSKPQGVTPSTHSNGSENSLNISISESTPRDILHKTLKDMFLVDMPEDFYSFWLYCVSLNKSNPADALRGCGLQLIGPYDVIAGKFNNHKLKNPLLYVTHWRYYYDTPEFQTVLRGDDRTEHHIGYFRDDPKEPPCFVASNCAAKDGVITPLGENIFGAVNTFLEASKKSSNPFIKLKIGSIQKSLQSWAKDNNFCLDALTPNMKKRKTKVVAKTFHLAGIVVPVQPKTDLGYRELIETDSKLKKILQFIVEATSDDERDLCLENLQPIITAANIANDECDFGTSLELGIDLFSYGGAVLHRSALQLLTTAYTLLRRPEFAKIIEMHLQFRRKGVNLSLLAFR